MAATSVSQTLVRSYLVDARVSNRTADVDPQVLFRTGIGSTTATCVGSSIAYLGSGEQHLDWGVVVPAHENQHNSGARRYPGSYQTVP